VHPKDASAYHYRRRERREGSSLCTFLIFKEKKNEADMSWILNTNFTLFTTHFIHQIRSGLRTRDPPARQYAPNIQSWRMCGIEIIQVHRLKIRKQFYAQWSQYTKELITITIALHRQDALEGISGAHFDMGSRVNKLPRTFLTKCPRIVTQKNIV